MVGSLRALENLDVGGAPHTLGDKHWGFLDFEGAWPRNSAAKENGLRIAGISAARYYELLHRAAATLDGQAHDPIASHRVLRGIGDRRAVRLAHILPTLRAPRTPSRLFITPRNPAT